MAFFTTTTFRKPRPLKRREDRKPLKKVARKGTFWLFVSQILTRFFLKIEMPRRCEACDGSAYCGPITPAHTRRRVDIRVNDWHYALRVAVLGQQCHYDYDSQGRRAAEPLIEQIIADRFKKMGLSENRVRELLLETAAEVQADNPKFAEFLVVL